jgi:hypothetical protein
MATPNLSQVALGAANPLFAQFKSLFPSMQQTESDFSRQFAAALRSVLAQDERAQQRLGFPSVAGEFSRGTRGIQSQRDLASALSRFRLGRASELGTGFTNILNSAPVRGQVDLAMQKAMQPSFLSTLFGGLGGTALNLFGPGLAMKALGNPQLDLIRQLLGGAGGYVQQGSSGPGPNAIPY